MDSKPKLKTPNQTIIKYKYKVNSLRVYRADFQARDTMKRLACITMPMFMKT
jgi:hypothetical protein